MDILKKTKTIEIKFSKMTFLVTAHSHFVASLNTPKWTSNRYSAVIKETGENISTLGNIKAIKNQMQLVNSKSHLFL